MKNDKDHARGNNFKASLPHMPVIDPIDLCSTVMTDQIDAGYSTILYPVRSIQRGLLNYGVHGNVTLKIPA